MIRDRRKHLAWLQELNDERWNVVTIYGESNDMITFALSNLERSMSRSLRFRRPISHKGAKRGNMLLIKQ